MPTPNQEAPASPEQNASESSHAGHGIDLSRIRHMIENQTDSYLKGVNNTDVEWFLRESSVTMPSNKPQDVISTTEAQHAENGSSASPVSAHLNTTISNSNDIVTSKTKPSIAAVRPENIASSPPFTPLDAQNSPMARRRKSSVSSIGSVGSVGSSGSFFSKLKGKLSKSDPPPFKQAPLFKENYDISTKSSTQEPHKGEGFAIKRSMSAPTSKESSDPRLEEYIKFYKQPPLRRGSIVSRSNSASSSLKEPLPSALINGFDNVNYNKPVPAVLPAVAEGNTGRLSSFLRRRSTVSAQPLSQQHLSSPAANSVNASAASLSSPPANSNVYLHPSFKDLKPLKRVAFHLSTFLIDPPQQIPSRTPRKGNVEILPGGVVKINPLSEEEKLAVEKSQLGQGGGIVVGGTFSLGHSREEQSHSTTTSASPLVTENTGDDDPAVDKHAKLFNIDKPMVSHGPHNYDIPLKKMALDAMYTRCCHLREILPIPAVLKQIPKGSMAPLPVLQLRNPTPTLVEVQTFADFVRIAPIICVSLDGVSLTLEQFKIILSSMAAKTQLEKLSLRNTPIDNDGWLLLSWFLSRNKVLNRLDITQCPSLSVNVLKKRKKKTTSETEEVLRMSSNRENRSDMDWSLLVATLVARGGIEELILTGCCINDLDVFEKLMKLAVLMKTSRLGLAYNQLKPKHFKIIIENWFFQSFAAGLDLGYNDFLSNSANKILLEYSKTPGFKTKLEKSSLGFVSLNSTNMLFTESFKEVVETILLKLPKLKYLDLSNNQRLFGTFNNTTGDGNSTTPSLGSISSTMSPGGSGNSDSSSLDVTIPERDGKNLDQAPFVLKVTDPSTLSEGSIITYFTSKFPLFPKLVRLHLENNNFSSESIFAISRILPFCKNLGYFSLAGNKMDYSALSALIQAIKNSRSLITLDCELEGFPDFFKEKIGLYSMRNMERLLYKGPTEPIDETTLETFESESLTEQLNAILDLKSKHKLDLKSGEVTKFVARARRIRSELKAAIDDLLKLQLKNELNLEGKETLIKFIFIDSSIEKGLQLIDGSLIDPDNNNFKCSLPLTSAEDEKSRLTKYRVARTISASDDQNLLVPDPTNIPSSVSPLNASRSNSRTNLQSLNRQEGSMLKLSRLHDFHTSESGDSDFLVSLVGLSGEDIRQKLMSIDFADLDKIIAYLDHLKQKGISLENVFNSKESDQHDPLKQEGLDLDEIKQKLQKLAKAGGHTDQDSEIAPSIPEKEAVEPKGVNDVSTLRGTINDAYDQVLNSFASRK